MSFATLTLSCGNAASGANPEAAGDGGGVTCSEALDSSFASAPESISAGGQCGTLLIGTKKAGDSCQIDSECSPTCCACPSGGGSAQVAWCNVGKCVAAAQSCCAFVAAGSSETDAGIPYVCQAH